uniref:Uncharacterized protein n=1 Tax=Aplanochytrium stocchinoi TaxID=215587 RepID=A0A7S3PML8_9STRA
MGKPLLHYPQLAVQIIKVVYVFRQNFKLHWLVILLPLSIISSACLYKLLCRIPISISTTTTTTRQPQEESQTQRQKSLNDEIPMATVVEDYRSIYRAPLLNRLVCN